jgi:acetylornithine/succinyldiaminopimelate/putrescine aminotransferase
MPMARNISIFLPASRSIVLALQPGDRQSDQAASPTTAARFQSLSHPAAAELARELCRHSFADRAFFCNSGAEANEAAIKLARRYGLEKRGGKFEILSTHNSFHGRTLATLTGHRPGKDPRGL